jgi:ATP-dependent exoDNAse (exonuclease V) beta subunit
MLVVVNASHRFDAVGKFFEISASTTLAVTFTNKATDEMKLRILSQLYGLAHSLPDSQAYADKIKEDFHEAKKPISDELIKRNAGKALHYLLHNYNYFRIQTIDAFFQQVTRNMARELNLNANFKLSLNDSQIEDCMSQNSACH